MPAGKLFQMCGPATANDLSHSAVLVCGASKYELIVRQDDGCRPGDSTQLNMLVTTSTETLKPNTHR